MSLPPAAVFPFAATTTDVLVAVGAFILRGWAVQETTGNAVASLDIYDGAAVTDVLVAPINLLTSESTREEIPGNGLIIRTGMFIAVTAGEVRGSLWASPLTHREDFDLANGEWGQYFTRPGA